MLAGITFLAILFWIYFSLSPQAQNKVTRFLFPAFLVTFAWVCCAVLGVLVNAMANPEGARHILEWAYSPLALTEGVDSVLKRTDNLLLVMGLVGSFLLTLPIDIVFGTMKLAFSLKFPFLTVMMFVWFVFVVFVREAIVKPQAALAARDESNGVFTEVEPFHQQVWRLADQKLREDAAKEAAAAARARNVPAPEQVKPAPVVYDKYPRPGAYKLPK